MIDRRSAVLRRLAKSLDIIAGEGNARVTSAFLWGASERVDGLFTASARKAFGDEAVAGPLAEFIEGAKTDSAVEKCLMLEKRFFLGDHNLIYTDKMAMAAGVEVRVPFLDTELVNFAAEVPVQWKQRLTDRQAGPRESQRSILPRDIIDRPKTGFGMPLPALDPGRHEGHDGGVAVESRLSTGAACSTLPRCSDLIESNHPGVRWMRAYTLFSLMCIELLVPPFCRRAGKLRLSG